MEPTFSACSSNTDRRLPPAYTYTAFSVRYDPSCFTSLLYNPRISIVGAHCPTNRLACLLPMSCSVAEVAMQPTAAHRNVSDGSFAVCVSIALATLPSDFE